MSRFPLRWFRPARPARRPATRVRPILEQLEARLVPSADVLTGHYDTQNTGVNNQETQLTPAAVSGGNFNKLYTTPLDGQVYAQPLVENNVTIAAGPNTTPGVAAGTHNVVFVATENDSVYALDSAGGAVLWRRSFLNVNDPNDALPGATSVSAQPSLGGAQDAIVPQYGITSTPVIDPNTNILYVETTTQEVVNGTTHYVQRMHALNLADGTDAATPFLIGDTTISGPYSPNAPQATFTNNTPVYVYGNSNDSVVDPYNGTGQNVVQFNAMMELNRPALSLVNGTLYAAFGSHDDYMPSHGWVVSWDVSQITGKGFKLSGVLNTDPNGEVASVWQAGAGLAFEPDGSAFYLDTGNAWDGNGGDVAPPSLDANGFPVDGNYSEAVLKVQADPGTSAANQNLNGWGMKVVDYFMPYQAQYLNLDNQDFGAGPLVLPASASANIPGQPRLLLVGDKDGQMYVINRDSMGKFDPTNDQVVNAVPNGQGHDTAPSLFAGLLSTPAYYDGTIYAMDAVGAAKTLALNPDGTLSVTSQTADKNFGYLPGSPVVSSDGSSGGVVWIMDRNKGEMRAYDAGNLGRQLWESGTGANALDSVVKFALPTVADGQVFVGTLDGLTAYGLTGPATSPPATPTLSASPLSASSVSLSWSDPSTAPNGAAYYSVEDSTDGVNFAPLTTAAPGATSLLVGGLPAQTTLYFRITGINAAGGSGYSNVASVTLSAPVLLDFSGGFAGSTSSLAYNGSARTNGNKAELTDGGSGEAGSVFSASPLNVTAFQTQFTFQLSAGANTGDGFTFTLQGAGPNALGPSGGGLGYGPDYAGGRGGIPQSAAVKFDLYSNEGEGPDSTGLYLGGAAPTVAGSIDLSNTGIDLHSGHVFQVNMAYDGSTLTVTIADTQTGAAATQRYAVNLPAAVGGNTAYVGFTGGSGGATAVQDILSWTYTPAGQSAPSVPAPSGLSASAASTRSAALTWSNNAAGTTGLFLDRATNPDFTQNLFTEYLTGAPGSAVDVGLTPGTTYYYRLRAVTASGASANSPTAAVNVPTTPAPPPPLSPPDPPARSAPTASDPPTQSGSLTDLEMDTIRLTIDRYFALVDSINHVSNPSLAGEMAALQAAININPYTNTPVGSYVQSLVTQLVLSALA